MSDLPSPDPVTTSVLWDSVVGTQLEELLYGLMEALGAHDLVWRSGSNVGVTASDGGRDLEATFDRATPDGELDRTRWWIEAKGRERTVAKADVMESVHNAAGRSDIDVLVFCTNSRFSNPTRDWVAQWQVNHARPKIRLWDRDKLASLVREHPTVAARVLPDALDDSIRLALLLGRFRRLGETPTELDLEYFWERQEIIYGNNKVHYIVAMFAYAEVGTGLVDRPWCSLIPKGPIQAIWTVHNAIFDLPAIAFAPLPRPLSSARVTEVAAYLILSAMPELSGEMLYDVLTDPGKVIDDDRLRQMGKGSVWFEGVTAPILGRVQAELGDICAADCVRVYADPKVLPIPLTGKEYWRQFGIGDPIKDPGLLVAEWFGRPCAVGFDLDEDIRCPLFLELESSVDMLRKLRQVVEFRRNHPDGQYRLLNDPDDEVNRLARKVIPDLFSDRNDI
ncbi:restriction endonuclease [Nocardia sp. NPDC059246]|uniref:restriction endonuclease n=1 Tax=unclassified Nocardia TaxID=2637762 RepID=UPI0036D19831